MRSSITRCLGGLDQPQGITVGPPSEFLAGDVILLCSDGLWSQVSQQDMLRALSVEDGFDCAVEELTQEAVRRSYPSSDNVTSLAIRCRPCSQGKAPGQRAQHPDDDLNSAARALQGALAKPTKP